MELFLLSVGVSGVLAVVVAVVVVVVFGMRQRLGELEEENARLRDEVARLRQDNMLLRAQLGQRVDVVEQQVFATGIPARLCGRLRRLLLQCAPLDDDGALQAVFADSRLTAWYDVIRDCGSRQERVAMLVDVLGARYSERGENALVLFMRVLAEQVPGGDACHGSLVAMADLLESAVM